MLGLIRIVSLDDTTSNRMSMDTGTAPPNLGDKAKDDKVCSQWGTLRYSGQR